MKNLSFTFSCCRLKNALIFFSLHFPIKMTSNIQTKTTTVESKVSGIFQKVKDIKRLLQEVQLELISLKNSDDYIEVKQFFKTTDHKRKIEVVGTSTSSAPKKIRKCKSEEGESEIDNSGNDYHYFSYNNSASNMSSSKHTFLREDEYVVVYTDGACEYNGKINAKAGIGVWFGENHPLNVSRPVQGKATNNTAEIQACTTALEILYREGVRKVRILTDSQFTINCITQWIKRWKKNNWKIASGGDVKNKEELIKLDKIRNQMEDVDWVHIRGHQGVKGNEEADKLARTGALFYKET